MNTQFVRVFNLNMTNVRNSENTDDSSTSATRFYDVSYKKFVLDGFDPQRGGRK